VNVAESAVPKTRSPALEIEGGILTVADELLKNDGQKFLAMMESLADKRIQREREAAESIMMDDDEDLDEDDEEYDDGELGLDSLVRRGRPF
jgi:hypothetical protein